jgi:hypothetical protein
LTQSLACSEVFKCVRCGGAVYAYGGRVVCSRCGATYVRRFTYKVSGAFKIVPYTAPKIPTAIMFYGVTNAFPIGYPVIKPTHKDTLTTADKVICFGYLYYFSYSVFDWVPLGDKPVNITISGPVSEGPVTVKTGGWYGEFNYEFAPGTFAPGDYTFTYEFPGDEQYEGCEGGWLRSPVVLRYRRLRIR